jgi:hypothetical protein
MSDGDTGAELRIESIPFGETYNFLLLMGHWERNYPQGSSEHYVYEENVLPTLLATGLKEQTVTGSGKVTVTMWPLIVDTVFTAAGKDSVEPVVTGGKPGEAGLLPVNWNVTWTIKRALTGSAGGLTALVDAQKKIPGQSNATALLLKSGPAIKLRVPGTTGPESGPETPALTLNGNLVSGSIGAYTNGFAKIGTTGAVNFEMEYVPFNLAGTGNPNPWTGFDERSAFDLSGTNVPVWIIRNGVNDLAQNNDTNFAAFHHIGDAGMDAANGNGAVRYSIAPKTSTGTGDGSDKLVVKDGEFLGPSGSSTPEIAFTTGGYEVNEEAEVYYAVVAKGAKPGYSDYIPLNPPVGVGPGDHKKQISLDEDQVGEDCDIYVIIYKDGEVSEPEIINTAAGGGGLDWIWGDEPYMSFYVASTGNDSNPGTKAEPLATVQTALAKLANEYKSPLWQGKATDDVSPGAIIILGTVAVTEQIVINNKSEDSPDVYPPIILRDDPETSGGKLQATIGIGTQSGKSLVSIMNGAKVTLAGDLVLSGTGDAAHEIRGITITGTSGTFTMTGGEISGHFFTGIEGPTAGTIIMTGGKILNNYRYNNGPGWVAGVAGRNFTMYGGEISGNFSEIGGGGVYAETFIMYDGKISNNKALSATFAGGGVYARNFTMYGGEISNNNSNNNGGGVAVADSFTMTGGEISGNITGFSGGGVAMYAGSISFAKTGGIIYGYDSEKPDDPQSNKVVNGSGNILSDKGHAVYFINSSTHHKDTTVGPGDNLFYNYPGPDLHSGW